MKVEAAVLVRNRARQMPLFLESLSRLRHPCLRFRFLVNDSTDGAEDLVRRWCAGRDAVVDVENHGAGTYVEHAWADRKSDVRAFIGRMAGMRDRLLSRAFDGGADACFMVDSDVLLHPGVLRHLCAAGVRAISPLFFGRWAAPLPALPCRAPGNRRRDRFVNWQIGLGRWPQCCEDGGYARGAAWLDAILSRPGVHRCGVIGACTLVRREVWDAGIRYTKDPAVPQPSNGEDRDFCAQAAAKGIPLYCSSVFPTWHNDCPEIAEHWLAYFGAADPRVRPAAAPQP